MFKQTKNTNANANTVRERNAEETFWKTFLHDLERIERRILFQKYLPITVGQSFLKLVL